VIESGFGSLTHFTADDQDEGADGMNSSSRRSPLAGNSQLVVGLALLCASAVLAPAAHATYPGKQGRIAYSAKPGACASDTDECIFRRLATINPSGSGRRRLGLQGDDPSWSADGRKIVAVDFRIDDHNSGDDSIVTVNRDGSGLRRLTGDSDGMNDSEPVWSPKGTTLLFTRRSLFSEGSDLYFVKADGTGPTKFLDSASSASWSSTGRIAFVRNGDIYRVKADGSGLKRLTGSRNEDGDPDWSPGGSKLIFTRGPFGGTHLYTMGADAKGLRRISRKCSRRANPAWAPDAKRILFEDSGDIRTANPNGSNGKKAGDGFAPAWGRQP